VGWIETDESTGLLVIGELAGGVASMANAGVLCTGNTECRVALLFSTLL